MNEPLRRAVLTVAILNLAYFGVEFTVAVTIRSVSLFADSIDFLEDAAVNLLIALALAWSVVVGLVTSYISSGWPDLLLGLGIAVMNADAAREVWATARNEHRLAKA